MRNPVVYLRKLLPHSSWVILAAVLMPRMLWFVLLGGELPLPSRDQSLYIHTAGRILSGHGLSISSDLGLLKSLRNPSSGSENSWTEDPEYHFGIAPADTPTAVMEPGYPVLLALFFGLFGASAGAVFSLNTAFALAGAFAVKKLATDAFGEIQGFTASLFWSLYPPLIYYTAYAMTETAHAALLMVSVMCLFQAASGRGSGISAGLSLGLFFLVRATAIFLLPLELIYLFWRKKWKAAAVLTAGFAMAAAPWVIRNSVAMGEPLLMPTKGSLNLWMRNNPQMLSQEGIRVPEGIPVNSPGLLDFPEFTPGSGELERTAVLGESAWSFIAVNPKLMIWLAMERAIAFISPGGGTLGDSAGMAGMLFYPVMAAGIIGLWRNRKKKETIFLAVVFLFYLLMHAAAHGGVRYRIPVDPVFLIGMAALCGCGKDGECSP